MRLTRKCPAVPKLNLPEIYAPNIIFNGGFFPTKEVTTQEIINKLGQLEDIEDELGIDLVTFVKATTQPVLFIKNIPFSNEIKLAILTFIHKNDINDNKDYLVWFEVNKEERYLFKLKDYGKTWALTKEELL